MPNNEVPAPFEENSEANVPLLNVPHGYERIDSAHDVQSLDLMHPYADYLAQYRAAGWRPLLLPPREKSPPPKDSTGRFEPKLTDEQWDTQLETWAREFGGKGNIALRVEANVIALDVDAYHGGLETIAELEDSYGALPATWQNVNRDDSSGHGFYRLPAGFEGSKFRGIAGPGIDLISHGQRYAVAPGSVHPSGRLYRWISPETDREEWRQFPNADGRDFALLPVEWAEALHSGDAGDVLARDEAVDVSAWLDAHGTGDPTPAVRSALSRGLDALEDGDGGRHAAATSATYNLALLAAEGHSGVSDALDELCTAFLAAVEGDRDGGEREAKGEWQRMLSGAVQRAAYVLTTNCAVPADDDPAVIKRLHDLRVSKVARRLLAADDAARLELPPVVNLREFLDTPDEEAIYRVDKLWPTGGRIMLAAAYKAGKTTIVANLLRSLVDAIPFLDEFDVQQVERVVLIDDELDTRTIRRWLREQGIVNVDRVSVVSLRGQISSFDILSPEGRKRWAAHICAQGTPDVVILDCLRPILDAFVLSEDHDAGRFLTAFDELLGMTGASEAVVVHHMGHTGERTRGDSRLQDWPDATWTLTRLDAEDERSPRHLSAYGRDVDVPEGALSFDPATRHLSFEAGGSRIQIKAESLEEKVVSFVNENPNCSQTALTDGITGNAQDIRKAGKRAAQNGLVIREVVNSRLTVFRPVDSTQEPG